MEINNNFDEWGRAIPRQIGKLEVLDNGEAAMVYDKRYYLTMEESMNETNRIVAANKALQNLKKEIENNY